MKSVQILFKITSYFYYISIRLNYMSKLFNFVAIHDNYTKYIHNRYTYSCPIGCIHTILMPPYLIIMRYLVLESKYLLTICIIYTTTYIITVYMITVYTSRL